MLVHALALLCALAAATFSAVPGRNRHVVPAVLAAAAGFVGGALWLQPAPSWVGLLIVLTAGVLLRWPRFGGLAIVVGGLTAGLWGSILTSQGLPVALAWILAASFPIASALLSARQPAFAPTVLREEGLLTVFMLGLVVAIGPTVMAGWGSASALNLEPDAGVRQVVGVWVLLLGGLSVMLGGWHSLRRRR